jgi:hypothetical protein
MEPCLDCGLPKVVCAALDRYKTAFGAFENGDLIEAHKAADDAVRLIEQYKSKRTIINRIELSDSDRLRLSGY